MTRTAWPIFNSQFSIFNSLNQFVKLSTNIRAAYIVIKRSAPNPKIAVPEPRHLAKIRAHRLVTLILKLIQLTHSHTAAAKIS
jgi:hypothetical protein